MGLSEWAPLGVCGGCIGKEEGVLDSYKSGAAIGPRLSCTQC